MSSRAQRGICTAAFAAVILFSPDTVVAQTVADRVSHADGRVQMTFPSRGGVCGDGHGEIGNLLGRADQFVGVWNGRGRNVCLEGPGRVVASVSHGVVTRLRVYVGPVPARDSSVADFGEQAANDMRAWLLDLARHGDASVAKQAVLPLLVVDAPLPWAELLALAGDAGRPTDVRTEALFWLAQGASARIDSSGDASDADEVRKSAVFALSQQSREFAVTTLIQVATSNIDAPVRAAALFWLGQTGDPRGLAVFAQVLGLPR